MFKENVYLAKYEIYIYKQITFLSTVLNYINVSSWYGILHKNLYFAEMCLETKTIII